MATNVKWIKICTDIFDDEKILLIENMPDGDAIIVIWFKLLCTAGKQNNGGIFMLNDKMPYTEEMLATIFRKPLNTVRLALQCFQSYGMIEIIEDVVTISNWEKHQSLEAYDRKKERDRIYQQKRRHLQNALSEHNDDKSSDSRLTVGRHNDDKSSVVAPLERDKEKEEDIIILEDDKSSSCCTSDVQRVISTWNSLGITEIKTVSSNSTRHKLLKARIKEHGLENVIFAIDKIRHSKFLKGQNKSGWVITFDWFVKPNNFIKVFEGNYDDRTQSDSSPMSDLAELHNLFSQEEGQ